MRYLIFIYILAMLGGIVQGQTVTSLDSLEIKLSNEENDTVRVNILNQIASDIFFTDPDQIIDYATQALDLSEKLEYKKGIAQAYNNLGIYYRVKGIYDKSIDYFFHSLEIMEDLHDEAGIGRAYNLIGIIYYYLNNLELSLSYYQKALEINEKQNDKKWIAGNSNNIGMIYERLGNYELAHEYYTKAIEMNTEIGNKNWLANNYGNLGSLYMIMNDPRSLSNFRKRLDLNEELKDTAGIAAANYLIGNYYIHNKNYNKSLSYLNKSFELASMSEQLSQMNQCAEKLSLAYAGLNEYEKAYYYHTLHKLYNDSLDLEANTQKIMRLTMQNEYRKEQQNEELKFQNSRVRQLLVALVMVLCLLLVISLYWQQRNKVNQHILEREKLEIENTSLQEELKFKAKLMEDNINYLLNKNDLFTDVIEKLNDLKSFLKSDNQKIIYDIIIDLQAGILDETWEEFELRFNQVHNVFYDKLLARFPNLTSSETRLCAFLKLNMSTKDIAAITGQSAKSIETARTRLRRKLNIVNSDQNLSEFLSQI